MVAGVRVDQRALCFSGQNLNIDVVSAVFVYQSTDLHENLLNLSIWSQTPIIMGVPAFFRWLSRKYASIVVPCQEDKAQTIDGYQVSHDAF